MWTLTFGITDGKTKKSSFSFNFNADRTVAQIEAWLSAFSPVLATVIRGAVNGIALTRSIEVPNTLPSTAQPNADVEEKLRGLFVALDGFTGRFSIPTLDETKVNVGSSSINQADADIILLTTLIEVGVVAGVGFTAPTNNRGSSVNEITNMNEVFTSSTSGG